jgi:hypothetical protein
MLTVARLSAKIGETLIVTVQTKKFKPFCLAAISVLAGAGPVMAGGYTTSVTDTVKLDVQGAGYSQTRTGSTYSVGGENVSVGTLGGVSVTNAATAPTVTASSTKAIVNPGTAFSFAESAYVGDAVGSPTYTTSTTSGQIGTISPNSNFGQVTTSTGGAPGTLAGTLKTSDPSGTNAQSGVQGTVTAGGAGTSATLQRSIDLTVFQ